MANYACLNIDSRSNMTAWSLGEADMDNLFDSPNAILDEEVLRNGKNRLSNIDICNIDKALFYNISDDEQILASGVIVRADIHLLSPEKSRIAASLFHIAYGEQVQDAVNDPGTRFIARWEPQQITRDMAWQVHMIANEVDYSLPAPTQAYFCFDEWMGKIGMYHRMDFFEWLKKQDIDQEWVMQAGKRLADTASLCLPYESFKFHQN